MPSLCQCPPTAISTLLTTSAPKVVHPAAPTGAVAVRVAEADGEVGAQGRQRHRERSDASVVGERARHRKCAAKGRRDAVRCKGVDDLVVQEPQGGRGARLDAEALQKAGQADTGARSSTRFQLAGIDCRVHLQRAEASHARTHAPIRRSPPPLTNNWQALVLVTATSNCMMDRPDAELGHPLLVPPLPGKMYANAVCMKLGRPPMTLENCIPSRQVASR